MKCACCGKTLAFVGVQQYPTKYNLAPKTLVECVTYGCPAFGRTASTEGHAEICEAARREIAEKGKSA